MVSPHLNKTLRVAVIGAGPAGLGALIALSKVEGVDVQVYEQAQKLREIGAVCSICLLVYPISKLKHLSAGDQRAKQRLESVGQAQRTTHPSRVVLPQPR